MANKFDVIFLEDAANFLDSIDEKSRDKIIYNIHKARELNDSELFKKLTEDIWEFRTLFNRKFYRILAFWDNNGNEQTLVIATNGFIKKTGKTPKNEIRKAIDIRKTYFGNK